MIYLNGDGTTRAKDEPQPAPGEDVENNLPAWVQVALAEKRLRAEMLEMVEKMRQEIASSAQVETKPRPDFITIKDIPGVYAAVSEQTVRWWIFVNREGFNSRCVSRRGRKVLINRSELEKWLAER